MHSTVSPDRPSTNTPPSYIVARCFKRQVFSLNWGKRCGKHGGMEVGINHIASLSSFPACFAVWRFLAWQNYWSHVVKSLATAAATASHPSFLPYIFPLLLASPLSFFFTFHLYPISPLFLGSCWKCRARSLHGWSGEIFESIITGSCRLLLHGAAVITFDEDDR